MFYVKPEHRPLFDAGFGPRGLQHRTPNPNRHRQPLTLQNPKPRTKTLKPNLNPKPSTLEALRPKASTLKTLNREHKSTLKLLRL